MGCGGRGSVRRADVIAGQALACERSEARETNGVVADGEAVWFWHPLLVSSRRRLVNPTGSDKTLIRQRR